MRKNILSIQLILWMVLVFTNCANQNNSIIITGADQTNKYLPYLKGKNVAMTINQSSTIGKKLNMDSLLSMGIKVVKIFGPEHGFRGNAIYILPIQPSPNLNTQQSIMLYPSLCLFEGTGISQGRGTYFPFQVLGNPDLKWKYSFSFKPVSIKEMSEHPPQMNMVCYGLDLRNYGTKKFKVSGRINLVWLIELYNAYPFKEKFFNSYFDDLAGTDKLRKQIITGKTEKEIQNSWDPGLS